MPALTKIREIMTTDVFTVNIDDKVHRVDEIIQTEKTRYIPVLDGKKFLGIITEKNLTAYSLRKIYDNQNSDESDNKVKDFEKLMSGVSHVAYSEDSILKALELMTKYKLECLPVVDWDYNFEGLLTSTDMLLFFRKILNEQLV